MKDWFCEAYPYRVEVRVQKGVRRGARMVPVSCEIDFGAALTQAGRRRDEFDPGSIVVVGYDGRGAPAIYDPEKEGDLRYAAAHRFDGDYGGYALPCFNPRSGKGTLTWLMRDYSIRTFGIYFDRIRREGRRPLDRAHPALIGDAEKVRVGVPGPMIFSIRPHAPFIKDLDGDGRNEMLMTTECWRWRGEGILAAADARPSGGPPLYKEIGLLRDEQGRIISYAPVQLHTAGIGDLTGDGRESVLGVPHPPNPRRGWYNVCNFFVWYENVGEPGHWKFRYRGPLKGKDGRTLRINDGAALNGSPHLDQGARTGLQFVDLDGDGREEVFCLTEKRALVLKRDDDGFAMVPLLDESGEELGKATHGSAGFGWSTARLMDLDGDGLLDLILANMNNAPFPERRKRREWKGLYSDSSLVWYRNVGTLRKPRFRFEGLLTVDGVPGQSLPPDRSSKGTFVYGLGLDPQSGELLFSPDEATVPHVYRYAIRRRRGQVELETRGRLQGYSAIDCQQCNTVLADMDGDGKKEMVCGHMSGRLQFYRNVGTRIDPVFSRFSWLRDEAGRVIWVCESNDPSGQFVTNENRSCAYDFSGKGLPDLLWGSGLGHVYFLKNLGPGRDGVPRFRNCGLLKDGNGDVIKVFDRCLPNVAPNLFGDGKVYVVVGGSHSGHAGHTGLSTDAAIDLEFREMVRKGLGLPKGAVFPMNRDVTAKTIGHWPHAIKFYEVKAVRPDGVPVLGKPSRFDPWPIFRCGRSYPFVLDWDNDGTYRAIHRDKLYKFTGSPAAPGLKYWKRVPFGNLLIERRIRAIYEGGNEGTAVYTLDDGTQMFFLSQEPFCLFGVRRAMLENRPKAVVRATATKGQGESHG